MAVTPLVLASPRKVLLSAAFNTLAYVVMWVALAAGELSGALLLAALALALASVAGMPYQAKPDADNSVSAEIAVVVSVIAGLLAVYEYGFAPLLAVLLAVGVRLILYTLGELIPPRKSPK